MNAPRKNDRSGPGPRGFSLIELLAAISIIGLLISFLLPAVHSARESARRAQCTANLRQIALAVHGYLDTWTTFPLGEMPGSLSANVAILPYLDQTTLYNEFNFIVLPEAGRGVGGRKPTWMGDAASTAVGTRVAVFSCPTEPRIAVTGSAPNFWPSNYAWNAGTWWPRQRVWDGMFGRSVVEGTKFPKPPDPPLGAVRTADCPDGLSTTLLLAEVALGPVVTESARTRVSDCYSVAGLNDRMTVHDAIEACGAVNWRVDPLPWGGNWRHKGYPWVEGTLWRSWFNTLNPPNQTCCTQGSGGYATANDWWSMIKPASAYHADVVHAAMADGSVQRFKQSINPNTWMALSTRAGSEVVEAY